jgi:trehalose 6-phosphate phosphatase
VPDPDAWADAVTGFRAAPRQAGVFVDFDGTLAGIVPDPDDARPLDGAAALLEDLADRLAVVAVLSGRPVAFLQRHLPPTVVLSGLYGLEVVDHGRRWEHPDAERWRRAVDEATARAVAGAPAGTRVESKGL